MRLATTAFALCSLLLPALAAAQYPQAMPGYPPAPSIIRPSAYNGGWRNHVQVPDGACGCAMPVRADCYDPCAHCGPICLIKHIARALDCLLPCNLCHNGLGHGCMLGGRAGCCVPAGTNLADPFLDDPQPPAMPLPRPTAEVMPKTTSRLSAGTAPLVPVASRSRSPYKVTSGHGGLGGVTTAPHHTLQPVPQSILRRTALEEARLPVSREAMPIIRSQSPSDEDEIPHNPLRR